MRADTPRHPGQDCRTLRALKSGSGCFFGLEGKSDSQAMAMRIVTHRGLVRRSVRPPCRMNALAAEVILSGRTPVHRTRPSCCACAGPPFPSAVGASRGRRRVQKRGHDGSSHSRVPSRMAVRFLARSTLTVVRIAGCPRRTSGVAERQARATIFGGPRDSIFARRRHRARRGGDGHGIDNGSGVAGRMVPHLLRG
jgi:hypothetical protein